MKFDLQLGMSKHAEMVVMYKDNGVNCHCLEADENCTEPFLLGMCILRSLGLALWSYAIELSLCRSRYCKKNPTTATIFQLVNLPQMSTLKVAISSYWKPA